MKIRTGFVANSSSSSFLIAIPAEYDDQKRGIPFKINVMHKFAENHYHDVDLIDTETNVKEFRYQRITHDYCDIKPSIGFTFDNEYDEYSYLKEWFKNGYNIYAVQISGAGDFENATESYLYEIQRYQDRENKIKLADVIDFGTDKIKII